MEAKATGSQKTLITVDRASKDVAREVFEYLLEDQQAINIAAKIFADTIKIAHAIGNQCWSLTLFANKIRLNVGPVEVLILNCNEITFILNGNDYEELINSSVSPYISAPGVHYPSVPTEQVFCDLPADKLDDLYPLIAERHFLFIQAASRRRKKSAWQSSFSPGVIAYLNELLGISLPVPAYFTGKLVNETLYPDEITPVIFGEGVKSARWQNFYERDTDARKECIKQYGANCVVCDFNFGEFYGEHGEGFIHAHHLKPISEGERITQIADLRPVCPNCHTMIHRYELLSIEELQEHIANAKLQRITSLKLNSATNSDLQ